MEHVNGELDQDTCEKLLRGEIVALLDDEHRVTIHTAEEAREIVERQLVYMKEKEIAE